jgi:hypothetical protein
VLLISRVWWRVWIHVHYWAIIGVKCPYSVLAFSCQLCALFMHLMQNKKVPNMILQTIFDMITWFYIIKVKSGYIFFERNFSVRLSLKDFIPSYTLTLRVTIVVFCNELTNVSTPNVQYPKLPTSRATAV